MEKLIVRYFMERENMDRSNLGFGYVKTDKCFAANYKTAHGMADPCRRMEMPVFPEERFVDAVVQTVRANAQWVPPYGSGASLYARPFMFGSDTVIGVKPLTLRISEFDRAAPRGTGHIQADLNYDMSLHAIVDAHKQGFDENVYLDSGSRTYIEETGGTDSGSVHCGASAAVKMKQGDVFHAVSGS